MPEATSTHYDKKYFSWQSSVGEFGGWANLTKFSSYLGQSDDVLDFGCGGGYLLKNLHCRKKIGIEPNAAAAEAAKKNGVEVYSCSRDVPDDYADKIISNNALEHALHPLLELETLYAKLKQRGRIIIVVPCESINYSFSPNDINHHLYTWSPMCLGNLLTEAGFSLIESKPYIHKWPPKYASIAKYAGRTVFEAACRVYGRIARSWFQVRAIAEKQNA
ncbi:MAG: class I SAM-dependent methyltransferase [Deltaproteobacteria bacterium]|nr:class I SAM-dependent methyltransferase [Deltaproteobacteria bacterium]